MTPSRTIVPRIVGSLIVLLALVEIYAMGTGLTFVTHLGGVGGILFTTAAHMIVAGAMLVAMSDHKNPSSRTVAFGAGMLQILLYAHVVEEGLVGIPKTVSTYPHGVPSVGAVLLFALAGLGGMTCAFNGKYAKARKVIGVVLMSFASLSLALHGEAVPSSFWMFGGLSFWMARPTLILFFLLGLGFIFVDAPTASAKQGLPT